MRVKTNFVCGECRQVSDKWQGKCNSCNQWNTFVEEEAVKSKIKKNSNKKVAKRINDIKEDNFHRIKSGIFEFDRVLGHGITLGSLTLIGGEPGIGKSTLLMEVASKLSNKNEINVLYVSGEESEGQIAQRAKRLGVKESNFYMANENTWQNIKELIKDVKPNILVIDSIQTTISNEVSSAAGSLSQVREVTYEIMNFCKEKNITTFIVGHVTKEGSLAGPKLLEHMVDTVIYFEGDQFGHYRMLRAIKNRFGDTNEVGIFEMKHNGLNEVANPSIFFLGDGQDTAFGRSLTCIMEGPRPIFVETQALVVENRCGNGRRTTHGVDNSRLSLLSAVIEKYFEIPLTFSDVYLNIVGGIKLSKRDSDLSIIVSILSSYHARPIDNKSVFIGEVGLTGEIRPAAFIEERLSEISQMNYNKVYLPARHVKLQEKFKTLELIGLSCTNELNELVFT
jgi:DNA repair protein RadA/Sms